MCRCKKCQVNVRGNKSRCPLCGASLSRVTGVERVERVEGVEAVGDLGGTNCVERYPDVSSIYYKNSLLFKILMLGSVIVIVLALMLMYFFRQKFYVGLFVIGGVICAWVNLIVLIQKHNNIHKTLLWQGIIITVLALLWDYFTKWRAWSVNYVIPITGILAIVIMEALAIILKSEDADYLIYVIMYCVLGLVPCTLIFTDIITVAFPSVLCAAIAIVGLAAVIIFKWRELHEELKKRLHL